MVCSWLSWQMDYLVHLQNFRLYTGGVLDSFILSVTMFGEITIPMLFICMFYWCIDKQAGIFFLWNYLFGFIANTFIKTTACIYRPWLLDERIKPVGDAIHMATSYSFPSGHVAGATSIWGAVCLWFWSNRLVRYSCIGIILLVMFSRNYLGVHTPQDVIVSLVVGVGLLFLVKRMLAWVELGKNRDVLVSIVMIFISLLMLLYVNFKSYPIDYVDGKILFCPSRLKAVSFEVAGMLVGVFCGWLMERRFVDFRPDVGNFWTRAIRFFIGFGLMALFIEVSIPVVESYLGARFGSLVGYYFVGLYITYLYPFWVKRYLEKNKHLQ